jgi:sugar-specific transcriptional regulator TrmB
VTIRDLKGIRGQEFLPPPREDVRRADVRTLIKLGLSPLEATVYLTLAKLGKATAKNISETGQIDRADTYRIIIKLQKRGLVVSIVNTPTMFTATPLPDALQTLLKNKKNEMHEISRAAKTLLEKNKEFVTQNNFEDTKQVILFASKQPLIKSIKRAIKNAQENIDIFVPLTAAQKWIATYSEDVVEASDRGVMIRVVIEKSNELCPLPKALQTLFENQSIKVLIILKNTGQKFIILDKKQAFFSNPNQNIMESPSIYIGNSAVLKTIKDYFETTWDTELKKKQLPIIDVNDIN